MSGALSLLIGGLIALAGVALGAVIDHRARSNKSPLPPLRTPRIEVSQGDGTEEKPSARLRL